MFDYKKRFSVVIIWFSFINNAIMKTPKLACQVADATLINGGEKK